MVLRKYRSPSHDDDDVANEQVGFALLSNDSSDIPWSEKLHQLADGMISISQTPSPNRDEDFDLAQTFNKNED